ncbi:hypothetical protein RESH_04661 [Rhodopirellula europaea SH398]|uniref:Uncharacterized protein n=1 Tax=Rhodopirellula europaea SH398 TaxID=1263868 RepID=M5SF57_9BACT|nr:hypothetical protein RESH_04661 [Rhodopirellula europaea SH398]
MISPERPTPLPKQRTLASQGRQGQIVGSQSLTGTLNGATKRTLHVDSRGGAFLAKSG